ncbi:hypothetical protein RB195_002840 [Necator americanus]
MDHPTKRSVLKIIASIYDSLGFIAPVTVVAKMFLQSLWKKQLQCYERLPEDKQKKWTSITSSWTQPYLELPRRIVSSEFDWQSSQIHIFTDWSCQAYCEVAYLRLATSRQVETKLLMGRTRLWPLHNTVTIPRFELSVLTLGSSLMRHLTHELKITFHQLYGQTLKLLFSGQRRHQASQYTYKTMSKTSKRTLPMRSSGMYPRITTPLI